MFEIVKPMDIEKRSFEIITELLGDRKLEPENELVIKRVIHTTADFDYADNLAFSSGAVAKGIEALKNGCHIVTDTTMALSGINKTILASWADRFTAISPIPMWQRSASRPAALPDPPFPWRRLPNWTSPASSPSATPHRLDCAP